MFDASHYNLQDNTELVMVDLSTTRKIETADAQEVIVKEGAVSKIAIYKSALEEGVLTKPIGMLTFLRNLLKNLKLLSLFDGRDNQIC